MKRTLSLIMLLCILVSLVACGNSKNAGEFKLGLGIVSDTYEQTKDIAQYSATVAAVVTDGNGKIVDCQLDAIQNKVSVKGGKVDPNVYGTQFLTKNELEDDYGMEDASSIGEEWYEQADFFADFVVGMTVDQVSAINTTTRSDGSVVAADDAILAGCTIEISDFIKAIVDGCNDENAKSFKASEYNTGVGVYSKITDSTDAADSSNGTLKLESNISAVVTDDTEKVVAVIVDVVEPEISFDAAGNILTDNDYKIASKREQGDSYGMREASALNREWYEHAEGFENYIVGLDGVGVNSIKTQQDSSGAFRPAEDMLRAECTIAIDGFMRAVYRAVEFAD